MGIALVGVACRYPDAPTPEALWENLLAQRQAFRKLPACRLRVADYLPGAAPACDTIATDRAALLEDFVFDRARFGVPGSVFRGADPVHWLALQVAAEALENANLPHPPRETAAVYLGNTLTGEVTRARTLRQRWPYVRRTVAGALADQGRPSGEIEAFLAELETRFKAPFEEPDDEALAGGLANTIAGRICAAFDFGGGGFVVDAACASSLLAVAQACSALTAGEADLALAGGVDISLDPFELVGFARVGAITTGEMRVYDRHSSGFLPGEGCGFVVLMREADAAAQGLSPRAVIRGWGISSDGQGSITRPEVSGQQAAMRRAYARAGYAPATVLYFEGHGTGTAVGDRVEMTALCGLRAGAPERAALGSIKANIGHTKAAAGIAGLIKALLCAERGIFPPTTGNREPHPLVAEADAALRVLRQPEIWPADRPRRAGISALGFGGINVHVTLERAGPARGDWTPTERTLARTPQDAELLLLSAATPGALRADAWQLAGIVEGLSLAEWTDLACQFAARPENGPARAAIVAATPERAAAALTALAEALERGATRLLDPSGGLYLGDAGAPAPLGFLFPGQGAPLYPEAGALGARFDDYRPACLPSPGATGTEVAQPALVAQSLAALALLERIGVVATAGVGHSLGELTALHWAGCLDAAATLSLARARGAAMAAAGSADDGMLSVSADAATAATLTSGLPVVVAAHNAPGRTALSGSLSALAEAERRARTAGIAARRLPVAGAFHSPAMRSAVEPLRAFLEPHAFRPAQRTVLSTITGAPWNDGDPLPARLCAQLTEPVRFLEAVMHPEARRTGIWIEVGPGRMLSALLAECRPDAVALAVDAGGERIAGLLHALAAAYVAGQTLNRAALHADRFYRPLSLTTPRRFLENPCERAPALPVSSRTPSPETPAESRGDDPAPTPAGNAQETVRAVVAAALELPVDAVSPEASLSRDFRFSSLKVSEIVEEAARRLGIAPPAVPLEFANATVAEIAAALENPASESPARAGQPAEPAGVAPWIRPFTVSWRPRPLSGRTRERGPGRWQLFGAVPAPLRAALENEPLGDGVLAAAPADPEAAMDLLLAAGQAVLALPDDAVFALATPTGSGAGFARSLWLESPARPVRVVHTDDPASVLAELRAAAPGYREARYEADGRRSEPFLTPRAAATAGALPLGPEDVALITGGGKGIAAECALALAQETGAKLALVGRAHPESDPELAANLARFQAAGATVHYAAADVTDAGALRRAVAACETILGPVTAALHGAGVNPPCRIAELTPETFRATVRPKREGLANLLAALDPQRLRLLVCFGSVIGRSGMAGEAHYAAANEWLRLATDAFAAAHPRCQALTLEWSVWSGVGMGEKLGALQQLERQGITPIAPEEGVHQLLRLLRQGATGSVAVTGRFGATPTIRPAPAELPPLRFIERVPVHYPGVELVAEADLSLATDPYLEDHRIEGTPILPAVLGLEAMAQAALSLTGGPPARVLSEISFAAPVRIPADRSVTLRLAALRQEEGAVRVALRSSETDFARDHFTATFHPAPAPTAEPLASAPIAGRAIPDADGLYDALFFQKGRFRRVAAYESFGAFGCRAALTARDENWFSEYLPQTRLLGDPGARDASLHALQVCIPHRTLVPVAARRIVRGDSSGEGRRTLTAVERSWQGERFVYDLEVRDAHGALVERWEGLELHALGGDERPVPTPLLASVAERVAAACFPQRALEIALTEEASRPDGRTYRPDGRPDGGLSRAHAGALTLTVRGDRAGAVGCDLETVTPRPERQWAGLLGAERLALARALGGNLDERATQLWTVLESLAKAGEAICPPLRPDAAPAGLPASTLVLTTGAARTVSWVATRAETGERLAVGLAVPERP